VFHHIQIHGNTGQVMQINSWISNNLLFKLSLY